MLLSSARARQPFSGLTLLVDPSPGVLLAAVPTATDAQGEAGVALPIPPAAALAGLRLCTQWLVAESGALAASDAVQCVVQASPLLAIGLQPPTNGLMSINPATGQTVAQQPLGLWLQSLDFDPTGRLAVGAWGDVEILDATVLPMRRLTTVTLPQNGFPTFAALHPDGTRAYVVQDGLHIIDLERASASFGTIIGTVAAVASARPGEPAAIAISADGRRLVIGTTKTCLFSGPCHGTPALMVVDVDPASPTRDKLLAVHAVAGTVRFVRDVAVSADGSVVYVLEIDNTVQLTAIATDTGQRIRRVRMSGNYVEDMAVDARGRHAVVANVVQQSLDVVDLQGRLPLRGIAMPGVGARVVLTPDGEDAICSVGGEIVRISLATGTVLWSEPSATTPARFAVR